MTKGRCKHVIRAGLKTQCALGLDPEAMAKVACNPGEDYRHGLKYREPCDSREWDIAFAKRCNRLDGDMMHLISQKGHCNRYEDPSDDEVKRAQDEVKMMIDRMKILVPLIEHVKRDHEGIDWKGIVTCPACGGRLHLSHAKYNGHVWGRCETDGCVRWME